MSIQTQKTGMELDRERFVFGSVKPPPPGALPPKGAKLAGELAQRHEQWKAVRDRHKALSTDRVRREARRKDADALGHAVRTGADIPEAEAEQQLDADLETCQQEMARHEAAGRVIANELDDLILAAADKQVDECRSKIDAARTAHQQALSDLEHARSELVANAAYLVYWREVAQGGSARWGGRPAGTGTNIKGPDGLIQLADFPQMTSALRQEAERLLRAVSVGEPADEPTA